MRRGEWSADPEACRRDEDGDGRRIQDIRPYRAEPHHAPTLGGLAQLAIIEQPDKKPPFGNPDRQQAGEIEIWKTVDQAGCGMRHARDLRPQTVVGRACGHPDLRATASYLPRSKVVAV